MRTLVAWVFLLIWTIASVFLAILVFAKFELSEDAMVAAGVAGFIGWFYAGLAIKRQIEGKQPPH